MFHSNILYQSLLKVFALLLISTMSTKTLALQKHPLLGTWDRCYEIMRDNTLNSKRSYRYEFKDDFQCSFTTIIERSEILPDEIKITTNETQYLGTYEILENVIKIKILREIHIEDNQVITKIILDGSSKMKQPITISYNFKIDNDKLAIIGLDNTYFPKNWELYAKHKM